MGDMLKDRVAVITGAGNGIGRAEAKLFAKYGAKVVVNDIGTWIDGVGLSHKPADTVTKAIKDAGGEAIANYDSVTTEQGANSIIQAAINKWGRIDILVNNAGIFCDLHDIYDIPTEDFDKVIKSHLYGTFFCSRAAAGFMKKQGYGRIISTSSHTGLGWRGNTPYSAAKEAIVGMTRSLARDMSEWGVTANAIRPLAAWRGTKETDRQSVANHQSRANVQMSPSLPEDIAPLVVYLGSEAAGEITGRIFEVWHGHVGIFTEPPMVENIILKQDTWTVEELAKMIPSKLTKGARLVVFPEIKMHDYEILNS
jgi:NAD(P)-dependent dehydrogenase (short-subunit alcohol dehydrogenase family)